MFGQLKKDILYYRGLFRALKYLKPINAEKDSGLFAQDLEAAVEQYGSRRLFHFEDKNWSYREFDARANQYAHWAISKNLQAGDCVALFMENCPDYVACWYGLSKVGVVAALLNNQISGAALAHCIKTMGADHLIIDANLQQHYQSIASDFSHRLRSFSIFGDIDGTSRLESELAQMPDNVPEKELYREGLNGDTIALYMFTSGTTGLPKAAKMTNRKVRVMTRGFAGMVGPRPDDNMYMVLPLYHATGGIGGIGLCMISGASITLKRRFSVSEFWPDIASHGCTLFTYIGEVCRYLDNEDLKVPRHKLRKIVGNGLRPEVWKSFQKKARIPHIVEFYGSTEGNASLVNFDGTVGAVGRYPDILKGLTNLRIVKFDPPTGELIRDAKGHCVEAGPNEPGELIARIDNSEARFRYEGYKGKSLEEDEKIISNAFGKGHAWFRTGDALKRDKKGYYYFVDRLGDTFRWKGENVSTAEVASIIAAIEFIDDAIVYGVKIPGQEGRAGMAGLVAGEGFDLVALHAHIHQNLPSYARPVFLRMLPKADTTGTFKYTKNKLVEESYRPEQGEDVILLDHPGQRAYVPLTDALIEEIQSGELRL